ncbi:MAG: hypothetical protein HC771_13060 [Synechococcales cyanobacterium CRU_2_2]|nr:hypothetical protein [Synechococcales cyanobacterium CRU_2_2]
MTTQPLDFRGKPVFVFQDGEKAQISLPLKRSMFKQVRPLVADLYQSWIESALDTAALIENDETWEKLTTLGKLFRVNSSPLNIEDLSPQEIEALFLTQNRTEAIASGEEKESYDISAYATDGVVTFPLLKIDCFVPGALLEMACINGKNLFLQQYRTYLDRDMADEGDEVTKKDEARSPKPVKVETPTETVKPELVAA